MKIRAPNGSITTKRTVTNNTGHIDNLVAEGLLDSTLRDNSLFMLKK